VLLSATLLAGWLFAETLYGPGLALEVDHKTVFSVLAWLTFAGLLIGRARFGWRGRKAVRVLYLGSACCCWATWVRASCLKWSSARPPMKYLLLSRCCGGLWSGATARCARNAPSAPPRRPAPPGRRRTWCAARLRRAPAAPDAVAGTSGLLYCSHEHREAATGDELALMAFAAAGSPTGTCRPGPTPELAFHRLWLGFMAARMGIGVVLVLLLGGLMRWASQRSTAGSSAMCATYLALRWRCGC
jgi:hypothetical protein